MSTRDRRPEELREQRRPPQPPAPAALPALASAMGNQAFGRMIARSKEGQDMRHLKEDTRRNKQGPKRTGGHDQRQLPLAMQRDTNYAQWYHQLKQDHPGDIAQIVGVRFVGPAFNISGRQEKMLRPYYDGARVLPHVARAARGPAPGPAPAPAPAAVPAAAAPAPAPAPVQDHGDDWNPYGHGAPAGALDDEDDFLGGGNGPVNTDDLGAYL